MFTENASSYTSDLRCRDSIRTQFAPNDLVVLCYLIPADSGAQGFCDELTALFQR